MELIQQLKECYENEKWGNYFMRKLCQQEWCNMLSNEEFYSEIYFVTLMAQICDYDYKFFFSLIKKKECNEFKDLLAVAVLQAETI